MDSFQFRIIVRLFSLLIRAVVWRKDPAGQLIQELARIKDEVTSCYASSKEAEPWLVKGNNG